MVQNKTLDLIHTKCHALRMMPKYNASIFEYEVNKIIAEEYQNVCAECKEKFERLKYAPTPDGKSGFLGGLFK